MWNVEEVDLKDFIIRHQKEAEAQDQVQFNYVMKHMHCRPTKTPNPMAAKYQKVKPVVMSNRPPKRTDSVKKGAK